MVFGSSKKSHRTLELVLDIRGDSVGGALISFTDTVPLVLYSVRANMTADSGQSPETLVPAMLTSLTYVLSQLTSEGIAQVSNAYGGATIKHITITFNAPWYTAKVKDVVLKKDKPFTLHQKAFDALVAKQLETEKEQSVGHTMIEHDVTHVVINGYELKDPFNKKTNEMLLAFYASFITTDTLTKINDAVTKIIHHAPITYRTAPIMLFTTLRDMFWNIDRFTVFDIGGSITEISIVEGGTITHIVSIPAGTRNLIQEIEAACPMNTKTIASTIAMLARGDIDPACAPGVLEALTTAQNKWAAQVQATLVDQSGISLPQRVFIATGADTAPVFKQLFSKPETRKNLFGTDQELQVVILSPDHFKKYITTAEQVSINTSTAVTAVFLQATK